MAAEGKSEEEKRVSEGEQWGLFLTARERPQIVVLLLSIGSARIAGTVGLVTEKGRTMLFCNLCPTAIYCKAPSQAQ